MASPAVEPPISDHLRAKALPIIDLRLLTQSELRALSLTSASSTVDLLRCDDVVVPTIDRSVFNESAGCRKQTYSRLRLAPRKPQNVPSSSSSSNTIPRPIHPRSHLMNDVESEENRKIVSMLKDLLSGDGIKDSDGIVFDEFVPVGVEFGGAVINSVNGVLEQVTVDTGDGTKKRRGRKARNEMAIVLYESPAISNEDRDRELMNENEVLVDLSALSNLEDPFGPELRRNTEGMNTDEELLGFITGLAGQWGSRRKRRKTVEASGFGDALPKGWKLLLSIKKKDRLAWINIRRYISPCGREFVSCKEISSYLQSLFEPPKASVPDHKDESNQLACEMPFVFVNDTRQEAGFTPKDNIEPNDISSLRPAVIASLATDCKTQVALLREGQVQVQGTLSCHKCAAPFEEEDDLLHHLLSAHIKSGKRRRLGTSVTDGVIIKYGVFECQFCHKIFHEKHRYNGHVGNHVKNYVKNLEASSGVMSTPLSIEPVSVGGFLPGVDEMQATFSSCIDAVAEPYSSKVSEGPNSGPCHIPVSLISETCTKENNQEHLPHDRPDKGRKRKKKAKDRESSDNTGKKHKGDDNKQHRVDESAVVADAQLTCSLCVESLLFKNENNNIQNFDEPNLIKLTSDRVTLEQNSDDSLLAFPGSAKIFLAEDNLNGASPISLEVPKQDFGSERALVVPNVNERIFGAENISDSLIDSATEELKVDGPEQIVNDKPSIVLDGPDENVASEFKPQGCCDVFSFDSCVTKPKRDVINNMNGIITSTVAESNEESGSERGLTIPLYDGQSSGININMNRARISTLDEPDFEMDERGLSTSSYDVQTSGFNINVNNVHSSQLDESNFDVERGLSTPPYDGPLSGFTINMNSTHTSSLDERNFEIDERDIPTSPYDGQSSGFNINMNSLHTGTLDEPNFEIDSSEIKELTFDFGNNDARPGEEAETTFEQGRSSESCFSLMSDNQQTNHIADNRSRVSAGRIDDFCMGKVGNVVSPSTVEELDFGVDKDLWKNELIMSLGRNQCGLDVEQVMPFEQRKGSETCSFVLPRNEQQFVFENNFIEDCNNSMDNLHQGRISETSLLNSSRKKQKNESRGKKALTSPREKLKTNEIRNSWSNELFMGLANSQAGQDVDANRNFAANVNRSFAGDVNRNFTSHAIDFTRNDHPYGVQNNVTGICYSPAQMHNQENDFRSSLFTSYGNDQLFGVNNNSKRFHPDNVWEGQRLRSLQTSRDNEPMIGFSSSLPRPVENVMNDGSWRTNTQNGIQTGVMTQSSDCFAPFDFISNKGDNEYLSTREKFDNISGFGGMQSNNYEQMEYNFFTPQANALPGDSSLWLGKDAMMPKAANRNQFPTQCLLCGAGLHPDGFNSGTQTVSIAYICPTCKAGQLNVS